MNIKENFPVEAMDAISEILEYGATKHQPGAWRNESFEHHLEKAHGHIHDFLYGVEREEDHIKCALCRLAMAVSVRKEQ